MRIPVQQRRTRLEMNMTPMIDVVFLLIIFFVVSSHLARQEVQANLSLPTADTGADASRNEAPRVTINIVHEQNEFSVRLGASPVGRDELQQRLQHELQQAGTDLEVRIRADTSTPYEIVEPVLVTCARLGIWNVKFAVVRSEKRP
ncbi:MAG: biopolymer transporter ExbD [Pirellulales bacterium]|nr:biopolymer transporter ExbD [Pirellulales bacterium]